MNPTLALGGAFFLCAVAFVAISLPTQAMPAVAARKPAVTPLQITPPNEVFDREAGVWKTRTTTWPDGNLGRTEIVLGIETNSLSPDGRELHRSLEDRNGGQSLVQVAPELRYDPETKTYVGRWKGENAEEKRALQVGEYNPKARTLTLTRPDPDGEVPNRIQHRHVTQYFDADTRIVKLILIQVVDGQEFSFTARETVAQRKRNAASARVR